MIDIEYELMDAFQSAMKVAEPKCFVATDYNEVPKKFPCVTLSVVDNSVDSMFIDSSGIENFVNLTIEVNAFSNSMSGKKAEAKRLIESADTILTGLGCRRMSLLVVPNYNNATVFRYVARYRAKVYKDKTIYQK